jgi:hypothetical protein
LHFTFESALFKPHLFLILGILGWLPLAVCGLFTYAGSWLIYTLFSAVFFCLLVSGIYYRFSFAYAFLAVFLWLGFWLKFVAHLLIGYAYLEPIGYFKSTSDNWDAVLIVSTVGALGVMLARLFFSRFFGRQVLLQSANNLKQPCWYPSLRPWLWVGVVVFAIFIFLVNSVLGVYQLGPMPLALPWPLTGLMGWVMGFGLPLLIFTMVRWDHLANKGWKISYAVVLGEGLISSLSSFSRATYLFHTLTYLLVLYTKRIAGKQVRKRVKVSILAIWLLLFATSLSGVMMLRYNDSANISVTISNKYKSNGEVGDEVLKVSLGISVAEIAKAISRLAVDRWIGMEGVMAVSAYAPKGVELFQEAVKERRERGKFDLYTKEISKVNVAAIDATKVQYATLPGAMAIFYLTGSLLWVLLGMFVLISLMLASERVVFFLTNNPYLCAFWGMSIAQTVASLGLGFRQQATYMACSFLAMAVIWIVQTKLSTINRLHE